MVSDKMVEGIFGSSSIDDDIILKRKRRKSRSQGQLSGLQPLIMDMPDSGIHRPVYDSVYVSNAEMNTDVLTQQQNIAQARIESDASLSQLWRSLSEEERRDLEVKGRNNLLQRSPQSWPQFTIQTTQSAQKHLSQRRAYAEFKQNNPDDTEDIAVPIEDGAKASVQVMTSTNTWKDYQKVSLSPSDVLEDMDHPDIYELVKQRQFQDFTDMVVNTFSEHNPGLASGEVVTQDLRKYLTIQHNIDVLQAALDHTTSLPQSDQDYISRLKKRLQVEQEKRETLTQKNPELEQYIRETIVQIGQQKAEVAIKRMQEAQQRFLEIKKVIASRLNGRQADNLTIQDILTDEEIADLEAIQAELDDHTADSVADSIAKLHDFIPTLEDKQLPTRLTESELTLEALNSIGNACKAAQESLFLEAEKAQLTAVNELIQQASKSPEDPIQDQPLLQQFVKTDPAQIQVQQENTQHYQGILQNIGSRVTNVLRKGWKLRSSVRKDNVNLQRQEDELIQEKMKLLVQTKDMENITTILQAPQQDTQQNANMRINQMLANDVLKHEDVFQQIDTNITRDAVETKPIQVEAADLHDPQAKSCHVNTTTSDINNTLVNMMVAQAAIKDDQNLQQAPISTEAIIKLMSNLEAKSEIISKDRYLTLKKEIKTKKSAVSDFYLPYDADDMEGFVRDFKQSETFRNLDPMLQKRFDDHQRIFAIVEKNQHDPEMEKAMREYLFKESILYYMNLQTELLNDPQAYDRDSLAKISDPAERTERTLMAQHRSEILKGMSEIGTSLIRMDSGGHGLSTNAAGKTCGINTDAGGIVKDGAAYVNMLQQFKHNEDPEVSKKVELMEKIYQSYQSKIVKHLPVKSPADAMVFHIMRDSLCTMLPNMKTTDISDIKNMDYDAVLQGWAVQEKLLTVLENDPSLTQPQENIDYTDARARCNEIIGDNITDFNDCRLETLSYNSKSSRIKNISQRLDEKLQDMGLSHNIQTTTETEYHNSIQDQSQVQKLLQKRDQSKDDYIVGK